MSNLGCVVLLSKSYLIQVSLLLSHILICIEVSIFVFLVINQPPLKSYWLGICVCAADIKVQKAKGTNSVREKREDKSECM